ncbi:hypothetical protein C0J52_00508 [Blattella germanica]|nr:hypothetical protein C0J52_00508 [Blattella germanica]
MWIRSRKINPTFNNDFPRSYHIHRKRMRQQLPHYVRNVIIRIVQDQRHNVTCDRLHKALAVIVCMAIAGVFISWAWKEFSRSLIEVNVETTNYPLYKFPFPAITICPATKVKRTVGEKLLIRYLNLSKNDNIQKITWNIMSGLSKCQYPFYGRMEGHFQQVTNLFQHFPDFNITHFMIELWRFFNASVSPALKVKKAYFRNFFCTNYNIGFGSPSTDACSTCLMLKEKQLNSKTPEEKVEVMTQLYVRVHKIKAKASYDILRNEKPNELILSYDCQKNLVLPKIPDQATYYSR